MSCSITIPTAFKYAPFYTGNKISYNLEKGIMDNPYFLYDIAYAEGMKLLRPWGTNRFIYIQEIVDAWKGTKEEVGELFKKRDRKGARPLMVTYIAQLISAMFWLNERHVASVDHICARITGLLIKPLNVEERLQFILESPDYYHSFIQLSQLYEEFEKIAVKQQILLKKAHK